MRHIMSWAWCLILTFTAAFLISCDDDDAPMPILDKEVRLSFPFEYYSTNETTYQIPPEYTHLVDFNLNNYHDIDSVFLVCSLASSDLQDSVSVRLFNVTDNIVIEEAELIESTEHSNYKWNTTGNLLDFLPDKQIDLAVQIKSTNGDWVYVRTAFLKLKRD